MLCTLPQLGAVANNSITGLHTIPHYNHSNCNSDCYVRNVYQERLWGGIVWRPVMLLLAIAPTYGKVHNIVYCHAYVCPLWHDKRQKMIWWILRRRGLVLRKIMQKKMIRIIWYTFTYMLIQQVMILWCKD